VRKAAEASVTLFSVWAPAASRVEVAVAGQPHPMSQAVRPGWWEAEVTAGHGTDYAFLLDGGDPLADPRSPWQPYGPAGASRTYDHAAFGWPDAGWPRGGWPRAGWPRGGWPRGGWEGAPLAGAVIYELHIGTFTQEGTLDAAVDRLDYLAGLGVTTVELMPVAAFPGQHGWGYDGIGLWAVHEPYGGPDALKRFVAACHSRGLAVYLDVVYNHVGPGNRLADFGPYFTSAHMTPWGPAVNLDQRGSDEVRAFIVENALMWLRDFHIDGLRLDAVHALADSRAVHLLEELAAAADAAAASAGRPAVLIAETDLNNPRLITPREAGGYGLTAQWNDDFHHTLHALVTGERQGYYADFGAVAGLAKTLTKAYFHDGSWSSFRGRSHGRPVDTLRTPAYRFVAFLQDHDQIGNRATGDRIAATLSGHPCRDGLLRVAAGLVLTAPFTPMLFMGEEWGADTPWQFFTDHTDHERARAVSEGRRSEFTAHGWGPQEVPDPQDGETFRRSKLDWSQLDREPYQALLAWYRALLALRRERPELADPRLDQVRVDHDEAARWLVVHRGRLRVAASLSAEPVTLTLAAPPAVTAGPAEWTALLASDPGVSVKSDTVTLPPFSVTVLDYTVLDYTVLEARESVPVG
jgi:maltooligosyltrehalose trehalohydrolase